MSQTPDSDEIFVTKNGDKAVVPMTTLRLLYECARSYETRIPEANGSSWAMPLHRLFERQ